MSARKSFFRLPFKGARFVWRHGRAVLTRNLGYEPRRYWECRGKTFVKERYQRGIYWQHHWMLERLRELGPSTLLEVGCGFGRNLRFLTQTLWESTHLVGTDVSRSMLGNAQQFLAGLSIPLLQGDARALPFRDKAFDVVLVHGLFMHVPPQDIDLAIGETFRVAKGYAVVCEQNYGRKRPGPDRVVRHDDHTFAYDYPRRFQQAGFLLMKHKSVGDLDAFLLGKLDAM